MARLLLSFRWQRGGIGLEVVMSALPQNTAKPPILRVNYAIEPNLGLDEFVSVLERSTLGERRPLDDRARIQRMLDNANLIVTARLGGQLVGVA